MKEEKLGQEPAFPASHEQFETIPTYKGASKRFYAACAAMQGILANSQFRSDCGGSPKEIIEYSYELADELLRQEGL